MRLFNRGAKRRQQKILKYGIAARPSSLDPRGVQDETTFHILTQVFETLVQTTKPGSDPEAVLLKGSLTARQREDGTQEWTGELAEGVTFSDGTPLTVEHVAKAFAQTGLTPFTEILLGDRRITFVLSEPNPNFPMMLSAPYFTVFHETSEGIFGTGPFRLADGDQTADVVRLERNPLYRGEVPLDGIHFVYLPPDEQGHATRMIEAVRNREIHITDALSRDDVKQLPDVRKSYQPGTSTAILHFNCERLTDLHHRKALAMGLDRKALARLTYDDALAYTASSVLPPVFDFVSDGFRHSPYSVDRELKAAATPLPKRMTLLQVWGPRSYLPHPQRTSEGVADQLRALGIEIEITTSSGFDDFYTKCQSADYDMVLAGWITDTPDPADFLEAILCSANVPEPGKPASTNFNHSRYRSEEMDSAIGALRKDRGATASEAIGTILNQEVPLIGLLYGPVVTVYHSNVLGFGGLEVVYHPRLSDVDLEI